MAVVDGGGEEADAVGGGGGEALHGVDAGSEVAAVGELRDVRRGNRGVLVAGEVAGDEGDGEEDDQDRQGAAGGTQDFGIAGGGVRRCGAGSGWGEGGFGAAPSSGVGSVSVWSMRGGGCMEDVDRSDEAVASLGEGLDIAGAVGGVAEGFADLVDGGAEGVVEVDDRVTTPEA